MVNGTRIDGIGYRADRNVYWVYVNGQRVFVQTQKQAIALKLQNELKDYFDTNNAMLDKLLSSHEQQVKQSNGVLLSSIVREWQHYKGKQNRRSEYTNEQAKMFKHFTAIIGDKKTDELDRSDIVIFNEALLSAKLTPHQKYRIVKAVRTIIPWAVTYTNHPFQPNATTWLNMLKYPAPVPQKKNRVPISPAAFKAAIAYMQAYLQTPEPTDPTKLSMHRMYCRLYTQYIAIFHVAANCSLDNADCTRLTWNEVILDADIPHINIARNKMSWKMGVSTPRVTPLAPQTVEALRAWKAYETNGLGLGVPLAFTNNSKGQWDYYQIGLNFTKILARAGVKEEYTFKSLRNVAPTIRRKALLPTEMSELILGHVAKEERRKYEDDVPPEVLIPLVEKVAEQYFLK